MMNRRSISIAGLSVAAMSFFAAPVPGQFCQESLATWGRAGDDWVYLLGADSVPNWFLAGGTLSSGAGGEDVLLLRYSPSGAIVARTWGGAADEEVEGLCVEGAGTLYLAGVTESFGGSEDGFVVKYDDLTGTFPWARRWDENGNHDALDAVAVHPITGNVFAAGITRNPAAYHDDVLLVKYDPAGNLLWAKLWASATADSESIDACIVDATDPNPQNHRVYLAGSFEAYWEHDALLMQMDINGNPLWVRTWDRGGCDSAYSLEMDGGGFVYVTGSTRSDGNCNAAGEKVFLTKWDAQGNLIWDVVWSNGETDGGGISIDPSPVGGIYLSGATFSNNSNFDAFLLKFDLAGQLLWSRAWGSLGNEAFEARYSSGEFFCAGVTDSCCGSLRDCAGAVSTPPVIVTSRYGSVSAASGSSSPANGVTGSPSDTPGCGGFDALFVKFTGCGPTTRTPFCFGDGSGTPCPCANDNNGCPGGCYWGAPSFPSGGVLDATGTSSMAANDTFLVATGISNDFGIFFGANNQVNGGNGNSLNDGLRCAGGGLIRLIPPTTAAGNQATTPAPVQTLDTGAAAGATRRYQYWFRTPGGPCSQMANLTNGYEITWLP